MAYPLNISTEQPYRCVPKQLNHAFVLPQWKREPGRLEGSGDRLAVMPDMEEEAKPGGPGSLSVRTDSNLIVRTTRCVS